MKQHDKYRDDVNDDLDDILHAHKVLTLREAGANLKS